MFGAKCQLSSGWLKIQICIHRRKGNSDKNCRQRKLRLAFASQAPAAARTPIIAVPHSVCYAGRWVLHLSLFPKRARWEEGAFRQGQDEWVANHISCRKGRAKFLLKAHALPHFIFLITEILKVAFQVIVFLGIYDLWLSWK